ncbi:hypothetical protein CUTA107171_27830 [Cupriavidus taiwanensis]
MLAQRLDGFTGKVEMGVHHRPVERIGVTRGAGGEDQAAPGVGHGRIDLAA